MAKKLYPEEDIQNIANAIRTLNGSSDSYTVSEMASAIELPENGFYLKDSTEANPLSITDGEELNAQSCEVSFEPIQDLNGYDSPWIDSDVINKEPYLMRAVSGTATRIGNSLYDKLVGGTVAFNQLVNTDVSNLTKTNVTATCVNKEFSIISNTNTSTRKELKFFNAIIGHVYYFSADGKITTTEESINSGFGFYSTGGSGLKTINYASSDYTNGKYIYKPSQASIFLMRLTLASEQGTEGNFKNAVCYDLTQMFGSTIADYIYSLTPSSGVAYFKSLFPKDYYDYNAGQLMSVKTSAHIMKDSSNNVIGNYALDSDLELRGIPKLDSNNNLYYDGDTYESEGTVTRRYGIVDLGSLTYQIYTSSASNTFRVTIQKENGIDNILCDNYTRFEGNVSDMPNMSIRGQASGGNIYVRNTNCSTEEEIKTALSGVYLVYELATPTTETADTFTNPQICDEYGTEEYTDSRTIQIPVGHETYQANICEISGWSGLSLNQCGKNLFDGNAKGGYIASSKVVGYSDTPSTTYLAVIPCTENTTYTLSLTTVSQRFSFGYVTDDVVGQNTDVYGYTGRDSQIKGTFTTGSGAKYIVAYYWNTSLDGDTPANLQCEIGNEATTYKPYQGLTTHTATFESIVYGGSYDFVSGKLIVTNVLVDLGNLNWHYGPWGNANEFDYTFSNIVSNGSSSLGNIMCSIYKNVTPNNLYTYAVDKTMTLNNTVLRIVNNDYTDPTTFKTAMSGIQFCYELETPQEITLTPSQIALLENNNVLWSDSNGNIKLKYFSKSLS